MERFILVIFTREKLMVRAEDFFRMETATRENGETAQALVKAVITTRMAVDTKARCLTAHLTALGSL
jgi:hypothetical protein